MWDLMNGMADGVRSRFMPRRRNGVGTMTAMLIGASVGIAAWEAWRRTQPMSRIGDGAAAEMAQNVIDQLED
ncbi:hypothetical protein JI721_08590 [Alicyclobacillus cycloheptanicus]|uniref:YtxH-like protein n=1 Tax=Alicyclobacillus cycloheptanicus TaxID=1457 RepID=A0ABT9XKE6_9BACL|nr:hypothetical protein [Alicyclobacillus cycloheptanicus]MDQ0190767.1 hypothetical protein [Alicyclobacillus cycloheptanicus]WDL99849.1 hypothetical protein JI721_08590 [Alicyclobacillus cycloheptanicus]